MANAKSNETNETNEDRSITPAMLAETLNVSPKALRAYMRSITANRAGKGGAWRMTQAEADIIAARFNDRRSSRSTAPTFIDPAG